MLKNYRPLLTADINAKGVLDIDVVKGCTYGIAAHGAKGCYQSCYAASIAKYRGIDFSKAVIRKVFNDSQAREIELAVKQSPYGFFRIGTMGDPCHAWQETVETVEWLAPYAVPIIITKHWLRATDIQFERLIKCGTVLNTSVSALDDPKHLAKREHEIRRYEEMGGASIARVVSCDFNVDDLVAAKMAKVQDRLFEYSVCIDNPLRIPANHELVTSGLVRVSKFKDLNAIRPVSMPVGSTTYIGHCSGCTELCGAGLIETTRPKASQKDFFN